MKLATEELPRKARERLPPFAQRMFWKTLQRARDAARSQKEAERLAWEAVRRKYGPRPGIKLWVRHDWKRTAARRPGDTSATSSSQRRLARVERARKRWSAARRTTVRNR